MLLRMNNTFETHTKKINADNKGRQIKMAFGFILNVDAHEFCRFKNAIFG